MIEKRFIPIFDGIDKRVVGAKDNGVIISFEDVFNLLNELHEENKQLKQFKEKSLHEVYDLNKENEQLRLQLNLCSDQRNEFHRGARENANRVGKLEKENEQLKFENENLKVTIQARDALIKVCEKKFRELGYIITVDDDGYVIE